MSDEFPSVAEVLAEEPSVLVLDARGAVLTCTPTALRLFEGSIDKIRGVEISAFFDDPSVWAELVAGALGGIILSARADLHTVRGAPFSAVAAASVLAEGAEGRFLVRLIRAESPGSGPQTVRRPVPTAEQVLAKDPRALERLELLHDAATRIGGSLDVTRNAEQLLDVLIPAFADLGAVDLTEGVLLGEEPMSFPPGTPMQRIAVAAASGCWPRESHPVGETFRIGHEEAEHLRKGTPGVLPDLHLARAALKDDAERAALMLPPDATSLMVLPLLVRGGVLGAVGLWRTGTRAPFDPADVTLADEIGTRVSLSLDNARRYNLERRTAEALQQGLLPRPVVEVGAAKTFGAHLPARAVTGIGGSWYDVIALSSSRVGFVVGNAGGQGMNATAAMGRLRAAVQTLTDLDLSPDEVLSHLNDLVVRFAEDEEHRDVVPAGSVHGATCLYAVYDPITGRCVLASAGHPGPVLVSRGGAEADMVPVRPGLPLGEGAEPFEATELQLSPGDVLSFYTGALARDPFHTRALTVVREGTAGGAEGGRPVTEIGGRILEKLLQEPLDDDLALLVTQVRRLPEDATAAWELAADPSIVAGIRRHVADQLTFWGLEHLVFTTELIVSELVTNAIRYGGAPVGLRLIRDQRLICEVSDPSQTQPHLRRARWTDEGGRGLFLVAQLTHRWGSRYTGAGKTIWTEQLLEEVP
ncbi:SpoIIE family protein phosphatase [Streptomyces phaeoluteigriseus]|uniref:SpoIIE family protein phosphatase n=1 Tax=Streptomyces phaeoluteigriseus TaxID=114686 RepID=A0ABY4Z7B5_9ACTN|nr:SpoIIE family protein phosphatase [Streptomyces phaeoluteigriseus]USQ84237.1 SpoIIE family protein phosphatase [Streptomyces phaeoluteigriseus]